MKVLPSQPKKCQEMGDLCFQVLASWGILGVLGLYFQDTRPTVGFKHGQDFADQLLEGLVVRELWGLCCTDWRVTWYRILINYIYAGTQIRQLDFQNKKLLPVQPDFTLFWKSHCVICVPAWFIPYHVTDRAKGLFKDSAPVRTTKSWTTWISLYVQDWQCYWSNVRGKSRRGFSNWICHCSDWKRFSLFFFQFCNVLGDWGEGWHSTSWVIRHLDDLAHRKWVSVGPVPAFTYTKMAPRTLHTRRRIAAR